MWIERAELSATVTNIATSPASNNANNGAPTTTCTDTDGKPLAACPIVTPTSASAVLPTTSSASVLSLTTATSSIVQESSACSSLNLQNGLYYPISCPSTTSRSIYTATSTIVPVGNTTTNGTSATSTKGPSTKNGLKGGAVAGVAIVCLVVGAALAAAILFVLYRRQKKNQSSTFVQHLPPNRQPEKGPSVTSGPVVVSNVDNLLPLPAEDDAIKKEVSKIRDNIKNHVREYYHVEAVAPMDLDESRLQSLAIATGLTTSVLIGAFLNPYTRGDAIRLFVAWVTMSRCSGDRLPTLLPDELSGLAIGVGKNGADAAKAALYSKWKVITGALLQQQYGNQQDRTVPSRSVAEAIAELNAFLAPFVMGSIDGGQRHRNLEMIMSRCANLAFLLFSQPGRFVFDFTGQNGAMAVFPALVQVVGDKAQTLSPPKVFWQKELAAGE